MSLGDQTGNRQGLPPTIKKVENNQSPTTRSKLSKGMQDGRKCTSSWTSRPNTPNNTSPSRCLATLGEMEGRKIRMMSRDMCKTSVLGARVTIFRSLKSLIGRGRTGLREKRKENWGLEIERAQHLRAEGRGLGVPVGDNFRVTNMRENDKT